MAAATATKAGGGATLLGGRGSWRGPPAGAPPRIIGTGLLPATTATTAAGSGSGSASARSNSNASIHRRSLHRAVIFLLISLWACLGAATAAAAAVSASNSLTNSISPDESPRPTTLTLDSVLDPTATGPETELLLIDPRIPVFVDGRWQMLSHHEHGELRRRAPKDTPSATTTTEVVIDISTVTAAADDPPTTTTAEASPLPSPFDGALAANFSTGQSCPNFINAFLSNATFKACYPVSLLLQGSQSFFEAEKSFFSITQVLDAACKADVTTCADYFDELASALIADDNCGREYDRQNALVVQAYRGMKTYETVYRATCLTTSADPNAGGSSPSYCFANAITNASTPSNAYLYYLPFNSTLPDTASPACGSCTRQTMEIYQAATSNRKAEIVYTYPGAAKQINTECGDNFVNTSLAVVTTAAATPSLHPASSPSLFLLSFLLMAISHWML
ncbi:hypothetical protein F4802DRAFT_603184 [Xylaria palmicola]|nr:hypothetical protein F4802DRAFT_603184 [Xylaria palmicola]